MKFGWSGKKYKPLWKDLLIDPIYSSIYSSVYSSLYPYSRGFIYSFRGMYAHWLRHRETQSKEIHFIIVLLLVNCNWWLIAYEVFSFFPDLSLLVTWSFPAGGCNGAHLGRKCFSFTKMKHFPGILNCLSFVIWNELLYEGSIYKGKESTFRLTFCYRKSGTFLATPSIRGLLQPEYLRPSFFSPNFLY